MDDEAAGERFNEDVPEDSGYEERRVKDDLDEEEEGLYGIVTIGMWGRGDFEDAREFLLVEMILDQIKSVNTLFESISCWARENANKQCSESKRQSRCNGQILCLLKWKQANGFTRLRLGRFIFG